MIPPEALADLAAALSSVKGACRVTLAVDCDPSGRPASVRVLAPGQHFDPIAIPAPRAAGAPPCHAAGFLRPERRPEPCASLLRRMRPAGESVLGAVDERGTLYPDQPLLVHAVGSRGITAGPGGEIRSGPSTP
jgi:hypothetical protein